MLSLEAQNNISDLIKENEETLSNDALEEAIKQCDDLFCLKHTVKLPGNLVYLNDDLQNLNGPSNVLLELNFGQVDDPTAPRTRSNSRGRKSPQDFKKRNTSRDKARDHRRNHISPTVLAAEFSTRGHYQERSEERFRRRS